MERRDELDESQSQALAAGLAPCRLSILGAPGTGKTTVLRALVQREVEGAERAPRIAVITQDRRAATLLRNAISQGIGGLPETVKVQTLTAFAYSLVQSYAQAVDRRDPELISGPDEDAILAEILAASPDIEFPSFVTDEVRGLASFRAEIRNLITRAAELGYAPADLTELSEQYSEPMWGAGARVMEAYERLTQARAAFAGAQDTADLLDHAQLVDAAASMLAGWEANVAAAPGSEGLPTRRPRWDWVLVDDLQNAPRSILALLSELAADGASIVVAGDPDAAVQGFRGGVASLPGDITAPAPAGLGCTPIYLRQRHRGDGAIGDLADALVQRIRIGGSVVGQRQPGACEDQAAGQAAPSVSAFRYVHHEEEVAAIARRLRLIHFREGVAYSRMAIVTRSRSDHASMRGSLIRRGIPVEQIGSDRPLREQPAVASLLDIIRVSLGLGEEVPEVVNVLTSCVIGIDPLELRRIGRVMRGFEVVRGGHRSEADLIELVLDGPEAVRGHAPQGAEQLVRAARVFAAVRKAAHDNENLAEEVLWAGWDASGRAESWRSQALAGGLAGDWADAALDSVIQLFRVAQRMADRDPATMIDALLTEIMGQDLPEDSIARLGAGQDALTLTTPSASQGRQWDLVVISGLQDGVWPNLRLRDSYTHTARLTQIATGRLVPGLNEREQHIQDIEETLDDELRQLYHAIGRANRRLILTCVDSDDSGPSRFFEAMGFVREEDLPEEDGAASEPVGARGTILLSPHAQHGDLDMAGLVGQLRRAVSSQAGGESENGGASKALVARQILGELEQAGVPEAQPALWFDVATPGRDQAEEGGTVSVSPSRVESFLDCPLQGFLKGVGAENADGREAADLGTFIHALAEELPHGSLSEYVELMNSRWNEEFDAPASGLAATQLYERARTMVDGLAAYVKGHPEPVAAEKRLNIEVGEGAVLNSSLDRVTFTDSGAKVADFKTGKTMPSDAEAADHIQMQLYQLILEQKYEKSEGAELVFLGNLDRYGDPKTRVQEPLTDESRQRARSRIEEVAGLLRGADFAAHPEEKHCDRCPFRAVCPAKSEGRMFS